MHDASYWRCMQLTGPQQDIIAMLQQLSSPQALQDLLECPEVLLGAVEFDLVLHQPGAFPAGALCPAKLMWLPFPLGKASINEHAGAAAASQQHTRDEQRAGGSAEAVPTAVDQPENVAAFAGQQGSRSIWIWAHAAAYSSVAAAVHSCGPALAFSNTSMGRLEVLGPGSDAALASAIRPSSRPSSSSSSSSSSSTAGPTSEATDMWQALCSAADAAGHRAQPAPAAATPAPSSGKSKRSSSSSTTSAMAPAAAELWLSLPEGAVLAMVAEDPRLVRPFRAFASQQQQQEHLPGRHQVLSQLDAWPTDASWVQGASVAALSAAAGAAATANGSSASATTSIPGPLSEQAVSFVRQQARLHLLGISALAPVPLMYKAGQLAAPAAAPVVPVLRGATLLGSEAATDAGMLRDTALQVSADRSHTLPSTDDVHHWHAVASKQPASKHHTVVKPHLASHVHRIQASHPHFYTSHPPVSWHNTCSLCSAGCAPRHGAAPRSGCRPRRRAVPTHAGQAVPGQHPRLVPAAACWLGHALLAGPGLPR
jgi:hypothetical protein